MDKLTYQKEKLSESRNSVLKQYEELREKLTKYLYLRESIKNDFNNEDIIDMFFTYDSEDETENLERLITCMMYFEEPTNKIATKRIKEDMKAEKKKSKQYRK